MTSFIIAPRIRKIFSVEVGELDGKCKNMASPVYDSRLKLSRNNLITKLLFEAFLNFVYY